MNKLESPRVPRVQRIIEIAVTAPDERTVNELYNEITVSLQETMKRVPRDVHVGIEIRLTPDSSNDLWSDLLTNQIY